MPIKQAAKKVLAQSKKKAFRNAKVKRSIRDLVKQTGKLVENDNLTEAKQKVQEAVKAIDKAIQKKIIKKNTGARKKSRLIKKVNKSKK